MLRRLKMLYGAVVCKVNKRHVRGKLVSKNQERKTFACPRCGRNTSYPIKPA